MQLTLCRKASAGLISDYRLYEIHGLKIREHLVKLLSKHLKEDEKTILNAAHESLEKRLSGIKEEIETRTPESSHVIAVGRPDVFQTSIFDRSSSSSDTGPETPGSTDRNPSKVSTWGLEIEHGQYESPTALIQEGVFNQHLLDEIYRQNFPLQITEDAGYDSDRESAAGTAMTLQPSQTTVRATADGWEIVPPRRRAPKPITSPLHRAVRAMERQRYRDSAGAYRAVTTADPRLTKENVLGFFPPTSTTEQPRGRVAAISGHSNAEVSLAHISKNSPPPARGGGMIQDRRAASLQRPRMLTGLSSYAAAVAGSTKDTILGWKDSATSSGSRPGTADATIIQSSSESQSSVDKPTSSAIESLQKFPIEPSQSSPTLSQGGFTPKPPYPLTPTGAPLPIKPGTFPFPDVSDAGRRRGTTLSASLNPYPSTIYPRLEGGPIFETLPLRRPESSTSSPRGISIPQPSPGISEHNSLSHSPPFLSLSFPDIRSSHPNPPFITNSNDSTYYPGHPEFTSFASTHTNGGYSSQPMSRDPSGQSTHSNHTDTKAGTRRRPSIAETEPPPNLPVFSPRIQPTSYQVYENLRLLGANQASGDSSPRMTREEWERESLNQGFLGGGLSVGEVGEGVVKRSPRLEYARSALIERLEEWNHTSLSLDE